MLHARLLSLPPKPLRLAQALVERPAAFLLLDGTGSSPSYLGCDPIDSHHGLEPEPDGVGLHRGDLGRAPRWVGLLPYEAMRRHERHPNAPVQDQRPPPHVQTPCWWRFGAVAEVAESVRVIGDDAGSVEHLCRLLNRAGTVAEPRVALAAPPEPAALHRRRIERALELIRAGQIYQVNLARRFELRVAGHPIAVLASLGARTRFPYCAALRVGGLDVVSSSPELFLKTDSERHVFTEPIKGTRPRGANAASDRALIQELCQSEKEAAELTMILDVERNDLGRVAKTGSVRLLRPPHVSTYPTLHHRAALLGAKLRDDCSLGELLEVMLPSGSVTGAPKIRAMQVIADLEAERRGLYTGAFGTLSHARELTLAMAIRTLTVRDGEGHYFSGGGIVADSVAEAEIEETAWKALQLVPEAIREACG